MEYCDYMLDRNRISPVLGVDCLEEEFFKKCSRFNAEHVYIWESVYMLWGDDRTCAGASYTCRLPVTTQHRVWPLTMQCVFGCMIRFLCEWLQAHTCNHLYNPCGFMFLPINYQTTWVKSKCSSAHSFPRMSIRHQAERAWLVLGHQT